VKAKTVVPREQANQDIEDTVAYYLGEGAESAALGFIDELEKALSEEAGCRAQAVGPMTAGKRPQARHSRRTTDGGLRGV
jgi:plasmid stabilization system protein ParE